MSKKILITGGSGAFGGLIIADLLAAGHKVAASMRDIDGRNKGAANALTKAGARVVEIDVTDTDSVEAGTKAAIAALGGLDVLINNAGTGAHGLLEAFTPEQFQRLFEINVFGVQRMMRAVLPTLRGRGEGLIINVSSLLGRVVIPFYGPYSATKSALEALTESYRVELTRFGVDVAIIEPGGYPTTFVGNVVLPGDAERLAQYGEFAGVPPAALAKFQQAMAQNPAQNPKRVAETVVRVVDTKAGARTFRNIVDFMGMGDAVSTQNDNLAAMTKGMYAAFGAVDMLTLKVGGQS